MNLVPYILTCPRPRCTLPQTRRSTERAGFRGIVVFDGTPPEGKKPNPRWNVWANLKLMRSFLEREDEPDGLLLIEDDIIWCRNAAPYLRALPWPGPRLGIAMPYCCAAYTRLYKPKESPPWHTERRGFYLAGFQAVIYPRWILPPLISALESIYTPRGIDYHVGVWLKEIKRDVFIHMPSLVQHTGIDCSAVGNKDCGKIFRSDTFTEDFDALSLLETNA